jgi:hypothetical protein
MGDTQDPTEQQLPADDEQNVQASADADQEPQQSDASDKDGGIKPDSMYHG